ncbi:MAG: hypothetical protein J6P61_02395 [Erysipelotrichaceae bacterium]|nr:hypothetical protein [Erysipelotrichaceae bacterium]
MQEMQYDYDDVMAEVEDILDYFINKNGILDTTDGDVFDELDALLDQYDDAYALYLTAYIIIKYLLMTATNVQSEDIALYINNLLTDMCQWANDFKPRESDYVFDILIKDVEDDQDFFVMNLLMRDFDGPGYREIMVDCLYDQIDLIEEACDDDEVIESPWMLYMLMLIDEDDLREFVSDHFNFIECRLKCASLMIEDGDYESARTIINECDDYCLSKEANHELFKLKTEYARHYRKH